MINKVPAFRGNIAKLHTEKISYVALETFEKWPDCTREPGGGV